MATVQLFPALTNVLVGEQTFSAAVPDAVVHVDISVGTANFLSTGSHLAAWVELSLDGGLTWPINLFGIPDGFDGGIHLDRNGQPFTSFTLGSDLPAGTGRRIRGRVVITGGTAVLGPGILTTAP